MVYDVSGDGDIDKFSEMRHFCKPGSLVRLVFEQDAKLDLRRGNIFVDKTYTAGRDELEALIEAYDDEGLGVAVNSANRDLNAKQQVYIERETIRDYAALSVTHL